MDFCTVQGRQRRQRNKFFAQMPILSNVVDLPLGCLPQRNVRGGTRIAVIPNVTTIVEVIETSAVVQIRYPGSVTGEAKT